ncbi:hypothetical protein ABH931_007899 [Streptacidiphilus sp. MAP12-33]|uniref:hypothetical protein n=1 Tax=Streptacidiphilus sp. MAP12-33 TaxID=3156266 RepID=UPI003511AEF6
MTTRVEFTRIGFEDARVLRGREKKSFWDWTDDLERRGCKALDYRLTGLSPVDRLCVRHLHGNLRAIVSFDEEATAWIMLVGPHDESDPAINVYARLWELCGLDVPPGGERTKPACCGTDGLPPEIVDEVDDLVNRCNQALRRGRR